MKLPASSMRVVLVTLLVMAVLGALGTWWWRTHERVEEWIDLPRTGEAAVNPLYALKLALQKDGVTVQSRRRLQREEVVLGKRDTVLLYNDPRTLLAADAKALLAWVRDGGHLIVRTPPLGLLGESTHVPLLAELGVIPMGNARGVSACVPMQVAGEDSHVEFCRGRRFSLGSEGVDMPEKPRLTWQSDSGYVFARFARGAGAVDVISELDFLTNEKLRDVPHVALTRQLLAPNYRAGTVHLVYAAQVPSLWATLLYHSWMAWLPLMLALLAWLWTRMQRFGPLLPEPPAERRSLLEHITASGEHLYRYGYAHLLHEAVRGAFLRRLRRVDPQAAALEGEPQVAAIAERFALPAHDVRAALTTPIARDHAAFRSRIATLIRLHNLLREPHT
ncbi:DUF4350 domain-containing protein [Lysobacter niastensis]|uniref:DUF4350 domain-containing protein n=1 Tax=Lysobacter niastensis TaxID=380629 RepID=A0ABS0BAH4_9GAMM|nr:DUF4350 domain-containing protein [Lysobacter niastensis]MBF6025990.1 DUF4350 domain-containing protein [Lysobacter niastensis]